MRANKDSIHDVLFKLTDLLSNNKSLGKWSTVRCGVLKICISDHIVNTRHEYLVRVSCKKKLFFTMTYTEHGSTAELTNRHDIGRYEIELFAQWLAVLKYCTDLKYNINSLSAVDVASEQHLRALIEAEAPGLSKGES